MYLFYKSQKKIIKFFKNIKKVKFILTAPHKKKILIYDNSNSDIITKYIKKFGYSVFYTRWEEINLKILIKSIIFFITDLILFKAKPLQRYYIYEFIKASQPKVVISFIDNRFSYLKLKSQFSNIKFILFQNGNSINDFRNEFKTIKNRKNNFIDYFFTFSNFFSNEYAKFVKGEKIELGSIKNNSVKIKKRKNIDFLYISQFRFFSINKNEFYYKTNARKLESWNEFYASDRKVVNLLASYCLKKKIKLSIAGFYNIKNNFEEIKFYKNIFKNYKGLKWKIYSRDGQFHSYKLIDRSNLVVFIDSALGYEALARNTKCVALSIRQGRDFGWPKKLGKEGPFWDNYLDKKRCLKKIEKIANISNIQWKKLKNRHIKDFIHFNDNNSIFKKKLKEIL
jgi:surface carbohydrate biosynthesis protein